MKKVLVLFAVIVALVALSGVALAERGDIITVNSAKVSR